MRPYILYSVSLSVHAYSPGNHSACSLTAINTVLWWLCSQVFNQLHRSPSSGTHMHHLPSYCEFLLKSLWVESLVNPLSLHAYVPMKKSPAIPVNKVCSSYQSHYNHPWWWARRRLWVETGWPPAASRCNRP